MTEAERKYYERRALEFDGWYLGAGLLAVRVRPGWHADLEALRTCLRALSRPSAAGCGLRHWLPHAACVRRVAGLDRSLPMLRIAHQRLPGASITQGDALRLPFR